MKNSKLKISLLLISLVLLVSIRPASALNQYSVDPEAHFRWDATKYYFMKDGLGLGNNLEYTQNYFLEFDFTNWGGVSGAEYLNGTINNNGTVYDGELSHATYYFGTPSQSWVTDIIDTSGPYPVHVYLVCNTEINQTTKPDLQDLADNSWLTFGEAPTNNFSLTGTYINGDETDTYTGNIKFNSDKVLSYVFDEMVAINNTSDVTLYIERYTWSLTYTAGTPGIIINSPADSEIFGSSAPTFDLSISDPYEVVWYTFDGGVTNITASGLSGTIDQTEWDKLTDGIVTITFYANNSGGFVGSAQVQVEKHVTEGNGPPQIPGYNIIALLGVSCVIMLLIMRKIKI